MHLSISDHIATLSFDRPEKANALRESDWEEMGHHFTDLAQNEDVHIIILTGQGKYFSAGIDLGTLQAFMGASFTSPAEKQQALRVFIEKLQQSISAIERCPQPVIAAVNGPCIGGGLDIAAACDLRYCCDEAYFSLKEIDLGIVADLGSLQRLPYIIQPGMVAEMAYTARKVSGPEAKELGLVNASLPTAGELIIRVTELAKQIASKPPAVVRGVKTSLLFQRGHTVEEGLNRIARENAKILSKL